MGVFECRATVADAATRQSRAVEFMVDTGSTYIRLPEDLLHALGVKASVKRRIKLVTGQVIERSAGVDPRAEHRQTSLPMPPCTLTGLDPCKYGHAPTWARSLAC